MKYGGKVIIFKTLYKKKRAEGLKNQFNFAINLTIFKYFVHFVIVQGADEIFLQIVLDMER